MHFLKTFGEERFPLCQISGAVCFDSDRKFVACLEFLEDLLAQEVTVEVLILLASRHPDVTGTKTASQFTECAQLIVTPIDFALLIDKWLPLI